MTALPDALPRAAPTVPASGPGHAWRAGAGPGGSGCLTRDVVAALAAAGEGVRAPAILAGGAIVALRGALLAAAPA